MLRRPCNHILLQNNLQPVNNTNRDRQFIQREPRAQFSKFLTHRSAKPRTARPWDHNR